MKFWAFGITMGLGNPNEDTRQGHGYQSGLGIRFIGILWFLSFIWKLKRFSVMIFPLSLKATLSHIWFHFIYMLPNFTIDAMSKKAELFQHLYKRCFISTTSFLISSFHYIIWTLTKERDNKLGRSNVNNRRKQQTVTTECINAYAKNDIKIIVKSFFSLKTLESTKDCKTNFVSPFCP